MSETPEPSTIVDAWIVPDGSQEAFVAALVALMARLQEIDGFSEAQILRGVDPTRFVSSVTFASARARDQSYLDSKVGELKRRIEEIARPRPNSYTLLRRFLPGDSSVSGV